MSITPVVFLSLAEKNSEESDLTVWARWGSGYNRLNYTRAQRYLNDFPDFTYNSPRVSHLDFEVYDPRKCQEWSQSNPKNINFTYSGPTILPTDDVAQQTNKQAVRDACQSDPEDCIDKVCSQPIKVSTWIIDSLRESGMGIGRTWHLPPVPTGSVYVGNHFASALGVSVGDWIFLKYDSNTFFTIYSIVKESTIPDSAFLDISGVNVPLQIAAVFQEGGSNKFPNWARKGYLAVLEFGTILETVGPFYHPAYPETFRQAMIAASRNGAQYGEAGEIIFACDKPRERCYMDSNFNKVAKGLVGWASNVKFRLGYDLVDIGFGTLPSLKTVSTFTQFLSLITSVVVALFVGLSCFLIYNLLMVSVETRTFELGILRMIGQTRRGVIQMILVGEGIAMTRYLYRNRRFDLSFK